MSDAERIAELEKKVAELEARLLARTPMYGPGTVVHEKPYQGYWVETPEEVRRFWVGDGWRA